MTTYKSFVGNGGMTLEEARAMQESLLAVLPSDPISDKVNAAARLLLNGDYEGSIHAYGAIAVQHPERRGDCEGQIGAAQFFLGQFEDALASYRSALEHGADPDMMADNIEEAEEAMSRRDRGGDEEEGGLAAGLVLLGILVALAVGAYFLIF